MMNLKTEPLTSFNKCEPRGAGGNSIQAWTPEDPTFWAKNKWFAWQTLVVSVLSLHLAFAVWFTWSALVVRLPGLGFNLTVDQRFWLPAMALLMGAVSRFPHTFMVLKYGGKTTTLFWTVALLVPVLGIGYVVGNPKTSFEVLLFWAGVAGFCAGGQISSSAANINLWFPKRLGGTALGVNVGLGNLGASLAQFLTPLVVGIALLGSYAGDPVPFVGKAGANPVSMWPQNAAFVYLLPVLLTIGLIIFLTKNHPFRAPFLEQFTVLKKKHAWITTILYTMTFGSFSGLVGAFPSLIREVFGKLPDAPDPLKYAWIGALVGALARPVGGILSDKLTGGRVSTGVALGLIAGAIGVTRFTAPTSVSEFGPFFWCMMLLFAASGVGNASVFKQIVMVFPPKEASPVLGFSAAMSVLMFGFFVPILIGRSIAVTGSPNAAFLGFSGFYAVCLILNWWYYRRKGAEVSC
jgi:MFS transporter, NNP family, nitrate/nitrite transporter